jgi:hypothetical protein
VRARCARAGRKRTHAHTPTRGRRAMRAGRRAASRAPPAARSRFPCRPGRAGRPGSPYPGICTRPSPRPADTAPPRSPANRPARTSPNYLSHRSADSVSAVSVFADSVAPLKRSHRSPRPFAPLALPTRPTHRAANALIAPPRSLSRLVAPSAPALSPSKPASTG